MLNKIFNRSFRTVSYLRSEEKSSLLKDLLDNSASYEDSKKTESPEDSWATLPYPHIDSNAMKRNQADKSFRPKIDPRETSIILFPGQGSQFVGMGKNLIKIPAAKDIYDLASEVLKYDLLKVCLEGPRSKLDSTTYCQPVCLHLIFYGFKKKKT